jgi:hypothetical protein
MKGFVGTYCESVGIDMNFATKAFLERRNIKTINKAAYEMTLSVKRKRSAQREETQTERILQERWKGNKTRYHLQISISGDESR